MRVAFVTGSGTLRFLFFSFLFGFSLSSVALHVDLCTPYAATWCLGTCIELMIISMLYQLGAVQYKGSLYG